MNKLYATSVAVLLAFSASLAFAQSESSRRQTQPEQAQSAQPYGKCFTGKTKEYANNGAKEMMADQDCHARR